MCILSNQFIIPKETDTLKYLSCFIRKRALVTPNRLESRLLKISLLFILEQVYEAAALFLIVESQNRICFENLLEISYGPLTDLGDDLCCLLLALFRELLDQAQLISCTIYSSIVIFSYLLYQGVYKITPAASWSSEEARQIIIVASPKVKLPGVEGHRNCRVILL